MPVPPPPLLTLTYYTDVTPLTYSGFMVVGHCLDCYSLLSVVFAVFPGRSPSRFPRTGHLPNPLTLILPMGILPTRPLVVPCLSGSLSVVSSQSLYRTALNVSFLRYIAFVFRLVCPVPSHGGYGHVSKGVEGKKLKIYSH